jgi:hypothetical protein
MATVQEQYTETVKQGQEALADAVDTWTKAVQEAWGRLPGTPDPNEVIDQFYAITVQLLEVQRDLAKGLVRTTATFADTVKQEAQKAADAVKPNA